ncbi:hypothetical protein EW145_g2130 [Phellinidium pouzarii]|uniref:Uncharacterized protein n=1 Tax=Phellinidium pouzarii TaxID=167371 RepID=A0A4S4LDR3_9AGAM|nr:hypothetical protein EW145_g2130 [Phellinidium pouzarii]
MPRFRNLQLGALATPGHGNRTEKNLSELSKPGKSREKHEAFIRSLYAPSESCSANHPARQYKKSVKNRSVVLKSNPSASTSSGEVLDSSSAAPSRYQKLGPFEYTLPSAPNLMVAPALSEPMSRETRTSIFSPPPSLFNFPVFRIPSSPSSDYCPSTHESAPAANAPMTSIDKFNVASPSMPIYSSTAITNAQSGMAEDLPSSPLSVSRFHSRHSRTDAIAALESSFSSQTFENEIQSRHTVSTECVSEAMEIDIVTKEHNMEAREFCQFMVSNLTYSTPKFSFVDTSISSGSSADDLDMYSSNDDSFAYSGRSAPSLSTCAFYVREASPSPLEVEFTAISAATSDPEHPNPPGDAPIPVITEGITLGSFVTPPPSPLLSPMLSPMPITPPALLQTSPSSHLSIKFNESSSQIQNSAPVRSSRNVLIRSRPLRGIDTSTPVVSVRKPYERQSGTRYLRRIVPKMCSSYSKPVNALRSPPLDYPYLYAAIDRHYGALGSAEERSLAEQLSLMKLNPTNAMLCRGLRRFLYSLLLQ